MNAIQKVVKADREYKKTKRFLYVPQKASIRGDQPLYYTVPGSWSGQQIPGRGFERPDTGLDDEAVL